VTRKIEDMRNLGPAMARWLAEVDIHDEDALRALGAVPAWHRLKFRFGRHVSLVALYAMEAALIGCDWRDLPGERKAELQKEAGKREAIGPRKR
jgi:DNA transformation protein and related proteins